MKEGNTEQAMHSSDKCLCKIDGSFRRTWDVRTELSIEVYLYTYVRRGADLAWNRLAQEFKHRLYAIIEIVRNIIFTKLRLTPQLKKVHRAQDQESIDSGRRSRAGANRTRATSYVQYHVRLATHAEDECKEKMMF